MTTANPECFKKVSHCIFDLDGTLIDSEELYSTAIQNLLTPYGKIYTYELKKQCMGLPTPIACAFLIKKLDLPITVEECLSQFEAQIRCLMTDVKLLPGVERLLLHLFDCRVKMGLATSSTRKSFNLKVQPHCNLMPVFYTVVCGDDPELKHGKPAPDIFLLAASRLRPRPRPECCLVFEDSPIGLRAGISAGMQVVMIPDPRLPIEETKGATLVLRSMEEFQPELFGLPPFDNIEKFTFG